MLPLRRCIRKDVHRTYAGIRSAGGQIVFVQFRLIEFAGAIPFASPEITLDNPVTPTSATFTITVNKSVRFSQTVNKVTTQTSEVGIGSVTIYALP